MKSFSKLTVADFQRLYAIHKIGDDDTDKSTEIISLLTGKTRWEVLSQPIQDYREQAKAAAIIYSSALTEEQPRTKIKINGKWFKVCLNPRQISAGQFIDLQHFLDGNQIENLHKLMACLLLPLKGFFKRPAKYDGANHGAISEAILDCNFMAVHSTCVFFLRLWNLSIRAIEPFLESELKKTNLKDRGMILRAITDGYTMPIP